MELRIRRDVGKPLDGERLVEVRLDVGEHSPESSGNVDGGNGQWLFLLGGMEPIRRLLLAPDRSCAIRDRTIARAARPDPPFRLELTVSRARALHWVFF